MSKGLASLIGALGAGMSGYAAGRNQFQAGERRKKLEGREDEAYEREKSQRDKDDRYQANMIDAQKDIAPEIETDTGATYGNEEAIAQDNRETARMFAATGREAPAPMAPAS
jgi:uncharacterized protein HemX